MLILHAHVSLSEFVIKLLEKMLLLLLLLLLS
jgi:hypothetical protein